MFFLGEGVDETGAESGLGRRDGHSSAARLRSSSLQPPSLRPLHVRDHGNPEGTDIVTSSRGGGGNEKRMFYSWGSQSHVNVHSHMDEL